jgi:hypothetical protein
MTVSATSVATLPVTTGADIACACQEVALTREAVRSAIGVPSRNAKAATRAGRIVRSARRTIESVAKAAAGGPVVLPRWAWPNKSHCRAASYSWSASAPNSPLVALIDRPHCGSSLILTRYAHKHLQSRWNFESARGTHRGAGSAGNSFGHADNSSYVTPFVGPDSSLIIEAIVSRRRGSESAGDIFGTGFQSMSGTCRDDRRRGV